MVDLLKSHQKVALDLDHTLIGSGSKPQLLKYLFDNYKSKIEGKPYVDFAIITFRYGQDFEDIEDDFNDYVNQLYSYGVLDTKFSFSKDLFTLEVHGFNKELQDAVRIYEKYIKRRVLAIEDAKRVGSSKVETLMKKLHRASQGNGYDSYEHIHSLYEEAIHYKGKTASLIGATALVDDLPQYVEKGCLVHGVKFYHRDKII